MNFSGVESGTVDVAVGALTMTKLVEARFDFTVLPDRPLDWRAAQPQSGLWQSLRALVSWQFD
jgi:hypothetical protein